MAPKPAAFRRVGRPALQALLLVQSVHQPGGIGTTITNAASLTNPTLRRRNALGDGIGIVQTTSVSQSQLLRLPATLNLPSTMEGSEQRGFAPRFVFGAMS